MSGFKEMNLDPSILRGVEKAGYEAPFPIQEKTIGPLLKGRNVIGQAKTGSGKTAAFSLPMLHTIDTSHRRIQALVLAPTRELAVQITEEVRKLGAYTGVRAVTIYGGQSMNIQREALHHGVHVVIGTPGRVIDHIKRGWMDLGSVKFVVIDEADTMLDMGFIDDVEFILNCTPKEKQMCLFSATMPERIAQLSHRYMANPERFLIDSDEPSVDTLDQFYASVSQGEKLEFLVSLLQKEQPPSSIIFCRTKWGAHRLAVDLQRRGFDAIPLHGNLSQHQRDHHMSAFRNGHADILVATDVASRGIDVSQVACVVNHDVPMDPLLYFHRVGRTARAGRRGRAFTLVSREESPDFARILRMTKAPILPMRDEDRIALSAGAGSGGHDRRHGGRRFQPHRHGSGRRWKSRWSGSRPARHQHRHDNVR
jgi:ATP-dependent RNA helicase DeaD